MSITKLMYITNPVYQKILKLDKMLTEANIPHTLDTLFDGWQIGYPVRVNDHGNVMDAIAENGLQADVILACGPMPMLRAIKQYAQEQKITAYISLEERMACGVGACLGCVVKTKNKDAHSHVNNARICTDGPVYLASEVEI